MRGMQASAVDPIDTHRLEFLSYPPPIGGRRLGLEESWVSVEPEIGDRFAAEMAHIRPGFPLRPGKTQRPLLPPETLRRDRLFDWLDERASKRLIFVVAEAGFGKTTLIADYARRSRLRTFWYRLDEDDTDGLVFLRYLVAACQAVDPRLLPRTASVLTESTIEPIRQETVLDTLLTEFASLGDVPSALVLDDFHMVESVPSIPGVVERLIERAPRKLTVIVAGRRTPGLSVAALRARGDLAELGREELRFDEAETGRLFREAYGQTLDPDVLHELHDRTDGWAASLQLVRTAVEGLSVAQVRSFVRSLSGAEGDLYDYLAEEVVGDLEPELREFLLRASLLEEMDPATAAVASRVSTQRARFLLGQAERLGLLSRSDGAIGSWRAHPLVREFLLARLELELGPGEIAGLHRQLAAALEPQSWRLAARHWAAAGDAAEVRRVVCRAVAAIIGTGDFAAAEDLISRFPDPDPNPWYDIIRSRQLAAQGKYEEALVVARRAAEVGAAEAAGDPSLVAANALNKLHLGIHLHEATLWEPAAAELKECGDEELASIGRAGALLARSSESGSLDSLRVALQDLAQLNRLRNHPRHEGITLVNLSLCETARGNAQAAVESGTAALRLLEEAGNAADVAAAHMNTARGLAQLGRRTEWRSCSSAVLGQEEWMEPDILAEAAELEALYGDPSKASRIMLELLPVRAGDAVGAYCRQVTARILMLHGDTSRVAVVASEIGPHHLAPGFRRGVESLQLQIRALANPDETDLGSDLDAAAVRADSQQAWFWSKTIRLTRALISPADDLVAYLRSLDPADAAFLSIQAELVVRRLADLDPTGLEVVRKEALLRPERWRWATRQMLPDSGADPLLLKRTADLLELVGEEEDVKLLRALARDKRLKMPDAGKALTRRLAPPAFIEDLGRITIHVGDRVIPGTDIRKKVLSLLAYLLTRPQYTATRDQVIEALWPDMEPDQGANSLNQTSYFLRQVFEPKTDDDSTAGYLNCRGDLIWLDQDLVTSRSSNCLKLVAATRRDDSPELVTRLAEAYSGRFAADFTYDDWACAFRETLHARYLDRVERSINLDTRIGAFDRAITVAQLALAADPDADQIELCLLRLYRLIGAHAAAAEQYAHYASVIREQLGLEPPPLETL